MEIANDTLYGLGAGVWTRNGNLAYRMGRAIKAGRVWTNCYHLYPAGAAFGGYKISGVGRENHAHDARALLTDQEPAGQLQHQAPRVLLGGERPHGRTTDGFVWWSTPAALDAVTAPHRRSRARHVLPVRGLL